MARTGSEAVSVVVLAGGGPAEGLAAELGEARARRVGELLHARAHAWACDAFGSAAVRVLDRAPRDGGWSAALGEAGAGSGDGATIALAPELAAWAPELAAAVLDDLREGCALSLGPVYEGGVYLLAVNDAIEGARELLTTVDPSDRTAMTEVIAAAGERGWDVGLLRSERALRRSADVTALLADPLCDAELRMLLE